MAAPDLAVETILDMLNDDSKCYDPYPGGATSRPGILPKHFHRDVNFDRADTFPKGWVSVADEPDDERVSVGRVGSSTYNRSVTIDIMYYVRYDSYYVEPTTGSKIYSERFLTKMREIIRNCIKDNFADLKAQGFHNPKFGSREAFSLLKGDNIQLYQGGVTVTLNWTEV